MFYPIEFWMDLGPFWPPKTSALFARETSKIEPHRCLSPGVALSTPSWPSGVHFGTILMDFGTSLGSFWTDFGSPGTILDPNSGAKTEQKLKTDTETRASARPGRTQASKHKIRMPKYTKDGVRWNPAVKRKDGVWWNPAETQNTESGGTPQ